jgi:hypothetical protein
MYQTMSIGLIDFKLKTKDLTRKSFTQIENIGKSPALLNDEYYQLKRAQYAKKYLTECFKKIEEKTNCENELTSFWFFSNKESDIGLDLVSILDAHNSALNRWPFYKVAINSPVAPLYCSRPEIQKFIIQKIHLETYKENFDGNYKNILEKTVPDNCFVKMTENLRAALLAPGVNGNDRDLAMNLLEAKKLLTPSEQDLYSVLFLLDGPVVGDKMNIAWKKIETLAENYPKRQKILDMIKALDTIPDAIFKEPNMPRHKAIINLFANNFPEFLNFYGKSCLDFINHKNSNPNISSSVQCNQFLQTAKDNSQWLSDSIQSQYSAIKK